MLGGADGSLDLLALGAPLGGGVACAHDVDLGGGDAQLLVLLVHLHGGAVGHALRRGAKEGDGGKGGEEK